MHARPRHYGILHGLLGALSLLGGLTLAPAEASYRTVLLSSTFRAQEIDSAAHGISDSNEIIGEVNPSPAFPLEQVHWAWDPYEPFEVYDEYVPAWEHFGSASGDEVSRGIDSVTNSMVGYVRLTPAGPPHAFYGQRCPTRFSRECEDIHPVSAYASEARGAAGGIVVGALQRTNSSAVEAALWNGTPYFVGRGTYQSLHRPWWHHSAAEATNGWVHVGGGGTTLQEDHAFVWTYTNTPGPWSVDDLHPAGYGASQALGVDAYGNQLVGWATAPRGPGAFDRHAVVWSRSHCCPNIYFAYSARDYTDIHRPQLTWSQAQGVAAGTIVGVGNGVATGGEARALVWAGTAAPALDLHQFLAPQFVSSEAVGVSLDGIIVGNAYTVTGYTHAVAWIPVTDFALTHDAPVRYVSASSTAVVATGTVTLARATPSPTSVVVRAGGTAQTVVIPAFQTQGRFQLPLYFAGHSAGTFRSQFTAESGYTRRAATLTVIRRADAIVVSP